MDKTEGYEQKDMVEKIIIKKEGRMRQERNGQKMNNIPTKAF